MAKFTRKRLPVLTQEVLSEFLKKTEINFDRKNSGAGSGQIDGMLQVINSEQPVLYNYLMNFVSESPRELHEQLFFLGASVYCLLREQAGR